VWGASGRVMVEHLDEIDLDHGDGRDGRGDRMYHIIRLLPSHSYALSRLSL
jgi:hypothetical protein